MANENKKIDKTNQPANPLGTINYILMAVCLLLIVVGFFLMTGSANEGDTFNYDIFNTSRTVVGPFLAFAGFVLMAFAIIFRSRKNDNQDK